MPEYIENPSQKQLLTRIDGRISTITGPLAELALGRRRTPDRVDYLARIAANNLEGLHRERAQIGALQLDVERVNSRLAEARVACTRFKKVLGMSPDSSDRLEKALRLFMNSPVASGDYAGSGRRD